MQQLALAALAALALIHLAVFWAVGHTLKPFGQIVHALARLQRGDYSHRLAPLPGREAGLIGDSVNRLGEAIETNVQQRIAAHDTERRLAESREWAHRVEQRLEAERREIASELHDELGQSVTAIRSLARSLATRLPEADATGREAALLIDSEAARLYDAMHGMIPRLTPLELAISAGGRRRKASTCWAWAAGSRPRRAPKAAPASRPRCPAWRRRPHDPSRSG